MLVVLERNNNAHSVSNSKVSWFS